MACTCMTTNGFAPRTEALLADLQKLIKAGERLNLRQTAQGQFQSEGVRFSVLGHGKVNIRVAYQGDQQTEDEFWSTAI